MTERFDLNYRQADEHDSPDLLKKLADDIKKLFPTVRNSSRRWIKAQGDKEAEKVAEIRAGVMKTLDELDLERERLVHARDEALRAAAQAAQNETNRHAEMEYELETARIQAEAEALKTRMEALREAVAALKDLRDIGVEIDLELVKELLGIESGSAHALSGKLFDSQGRVTDELPPQWVGD